MLSAVSAGGGAASTGAGSGSAVGRFIRDSRRAFWLSFLVWLISAELPVVRSVRSSTRVCGGGMEPVTSVMDAPGLVVAGVDDALGGEAAASGTSR